VAPLLTTETSYPVPTAFPVPTTKEAPTAFADVVNAFFRNKRKIVIAAVSFLLLVLAIFILIPKQYDAHMMFMVRDEGSTFPINSFDDRPQAQQPEQAMTDVQIGTEIELLQGNELHRQVISTMHPGLSSSQLDSRLLTFNKELTVLPVPKTTLISVTYSATSKEEAVATLATLSKLYLTYRAKIRGSDGAYAFFDQEATRYYQQLQGDQAALAKFNQANQVSLLNEEKDVVVHKLSDARAALYDNEANVREADKRIQTMQSARSTMPARVTTERRDIPDQVVAERLNATLVDLENKRVELLTKYHPTDRHVQEVDDQIANTREALKQAQASKSVEEQTDLNPIRQTVEADLQQSTFRSAGLQAREKSLAAQVNEYQAKLQQLNGITGQSDDLQRKIKQDEANYDIYSKRREDARISRTLDNDKIANVRLVVAPALVPQADIETVISVVCICVIGVLLIVGVGVLAGLWSPSFHSPWELENAIGAPVLATIPLLSNGNGHMKALPRPTNGNGASNGLNLHDSSQKGGYLESLTDNVPAQMSSISRYVGGIDEDCFESGGAYLPLIEKLRRIDPSEPGGGTVFTFTACNQGEGVSHFVRDLGVELTNYTGKKVAIVNAPDTYESAIGSDSLAATEFRGRATHSGENFLKQWFKRLRETHDYVLIDCPPLSSSRAATIFGPQSDGLLLVVGAGEATRIQLRGSLAMLSLASVRVIGLALNKRSYPIPDAIYNRL
jgi:uncharacterized protein involved in exopolysaccharide biosynthesis